MLRRSRITNAGFSTSGKNSKIYANAAITRGRQRGNQRSISSPANAHVRSDSGDATDGRVSVPRDAQPQSKQRNRQRGRKISRSKRHQGKWPALQTSTGNS